ncbi:hypothetical protein E2C01_037823 [Portunus trituberculatus]|uniref:Uncharacterized protein n=1 Tax=Portunus trituberculatus TaxID=210409 RepID=A0A5B7FFZ8_PORTR|nr:hypothetical protein [Portunus trituberculatus]
MAQKDATFVSVTWSSILDLHLEARFLSTRKLLLRPGHLLTQGGSTKPQRGCPSCLLRENLDESKHNKSEPM